MSCKFFIKNNEQEFKDSYFQATKKIEGLMPFNAKKEIDKKLSLFVDKINSLRLINEL